MGWLDLPVSALAATELQEQKVTAKIPISMRELQIFLGFAGRTAIVTIPTGSISASQQRVNLCDSCVVIVAVTTTGMSTLGVHRGFLRKYGECVKLLAWLMFC
ncbi:unnamed protein product [Tetraodon nigroviridis]|uniref:(spotted green pufferfish) hypothetical protein n=1 Tax=Tetraodon nigroviridis TaxID=99883 RepID=Q4RFS6_TETNG|nr:unnamed protein product [Tetraodon nigroviridis]